MNQSVQTIMIIAGGTGGHIFPGLSVARYLMNHGYKVVWIGSKDRIESELVPVYNIDIKYICIQGLRGKKIYQKLITLLFLIFFAMYQSFKIIRCWKPDIVLSMGGYVSGPSSLVAWLYGIPVIIHEQNRIMGLTNRYVSRFAKKILQGFPNTVNGAITSGNPLRYEILSIPDPVHRLEGRTGPIRVLVVGGSTGSFIFNKVIPEVFGKLFGKLIIWHQSGKKGFNDTIQAYKKLHCNSSNYKVVPFIDNMAHAYSWADVIISRSGALMVSEISYVGLPAIFVPFNYHKDYQQYWNAFQLVKSGSAIIIEQERFTSDYVSIILGNWNRKVLLNMAILSKSLEMSNATQLVAQTVMRYLNGK
ncbi:UDP-N-acetylglucosamine:N-acetylmuramyl-(pentapeptide) pyrophosphoryl-undecaprenol N-acetylglucosamine transferase [Candidatus Blochmanniella floridana]|uniref:UDP-N-acetylglucosamine--N-acetylmuramyl-(pentapeptide) pyrophosphoryl-undecaprenol N-acetylglucosamine transferase n=1 Tax=Blochmanniella floridana TaxID=203907 RepID=MURG_BLOFL|nr:RecName: Full=UDP-N-acetylglucosamine--N-acetylmuramyl-(pentapeptide) pyrophosphoryl-undecaprenol N-acetylglucosamine transferase; AltName: Full=Undecaprenyl-PP-MurNAc-pentapeptide-UDPGlcNAc GlcNAc transferase [Candidatus Blochmannia floridanus]CAD83663.1 UDP-N-acetylglucosamine:N-acetylmuramyl-(pentapeptide) pyrophosphoryl-undecaprenol N-acetylglucosamine transferase [Candidatus Blochmannia floridanus]